MFFSLFILSQFPLGGLSISCSLGMEVVPVNRALSAAQDLFKKQKWGDAVLAYQPLVKAHPGSIPLAMDLGTAYVFQSNRLAGLSLLVDLWTHASQRDKKKIENQLNILSRIFLVNKNFDLYQEALNLMEVKKYTQARAKLVKALSEEPHHLDVILRIAQCLIFEERYQQAIHELTQIKQWTFFAPEISLWLGRAYLLNGAESQSAQKAILELKTAASKMRGNEVLVLWLVQAYVNLGQIQQAMAILDSDVATYPLHIISLLKSAQIRMQTHKTDLSSLWVVRKNLQLAMSRFEQDQFTQVLNVYELTYGQRKKPEELRLTLQELLQQVELQLEELGTSHE